MSKIVKAVVGGVASIFGGGSPKPPPAPKPVPMADPQSPEVQAARRRAMQRQMGSSGRESTMLSGGVFGSDTLG
jgi:hypothetical protein